MTEVIYWNGVPKRGGTIVEFPSMDGFGPISCGVRSTASVCKLCSNFFGATDRGTRLNYKTRASRDLLANFCAPLCPRHKNWQFAMVGRYPL